MGRRARDRRRGESDLVPRPPSSPANLLILTIVGVLGLTAVAAAVMGSGFDDVTPHGQLLGDLQRVADAQERHYARTGTFAEWLPTLGVEPHPDARITVLHADATEWEAVANHSAGLTCMRSGRVEGGVARSHPPACFVPGP